MNNLFKILTLVVCSMANILFADPFSFQILQAPKEKAKVPQGAPADNAVRKNSSVENSNVASISAGNDIVMAHDVKRMAGKANYTHIHIVLDASNSMQPYKKYIIDSFPYFFQEQRKLQGDVTISIWRFPIYKPELHRKYKLGGSASSAVVDRKLYKAEREAARKAVSAERAKINANAKNKSMYTEEIIDFKPLKSNLSLGEYKLSGSTPAYEAAIYTIRDLDVQIKKLQKKSQNPASVVYILITDGKSGVVNYTEADVAAEIFKHSEDWNFLLLGLGKGMANFGSSIGLPYQNCYDILVNTPKDAEIVWKAINEFVKRSRVL